MPSKKKKYNARFPPARIKKIMQKDEDVGKVAAPVPVLIFHSAKALEIFVEGLITKASQETLSRNAKTLTTSHIKQCIEQENKFDFLRDLVESVPTISCEDEDTNSTGSHPTDRSTNTRRKGRIGRDASTQGSVQSQDSVQSQSSVQSVDEPSSDEESCESDESSNIKDDRQRHPAETTGVFTSNSSWSSSSFSQQRSHAAPTSSQNSFPGPGQPSSSVRFSPAMPPPHLPHTNAPAMGAYLAPHPHTTQHIDNGDNSDEDYDA